MALMTSTEVKAFLRLSVSTYDTLIATYIPIIEKDICEYCNNYFVDEQTLKYGASGIAFVRGDTASTSSSPDTITDDATEFSAIGFQSFMDIIVAGGKANEGIHHLAGVSTGTLILTSTGTLIDQDQDASYWPVGPITIARIKWPENMKPIAAKMIWAQIADSKPGNVKSESIDDYSATYINGNAYPARLIKGLDRWRKVIVA